MNSRNLTNRSANNRTMNSTQNRRWLWMLTLSAALLTPATMARADEPLGSTDDQDDVMAHTGQPVKPGGGGNFDGGQSGNDSVMPSPLNSGPLVPWRWILNGGGERPSAPGPMTRVLTLPTDLRSLSPVLAVATPASDGSAWTPGNSGPASIPAPGAVMILGGAAISALRRRRA